MIDKDYANYAATQVINTIEGGYVAQTVTSRLSELARVLGSSVDISFMQPETAHTYLLALLAKALTERELT